MAHPHVVFDGYSYEPPSYEEAQASASANQSVYKPTVSQSRDTNIGGFRPLYTPNGYNGLTEYNIAKRRRRMRIAAATALAVFCSVILIPILFWNINSVYHVSKSYKNYVDQSDQDLTLYKSYNGNQGDNQRYKDSSSFNNDDYYREPVNDDKSIHDSNDNVLAATEVNVNSENNNPVTNNGGIYGGYDWEKEAQKILEKLQSEDFGIHSPNARDEKESSIEQNYDKIFTDANEFLRKEMEKFNLNKFEDNSANTEQEKETSANKNSDDSFEFDVILQKELEKLKAGDDSDEIEENKLWNTYLENELEKLNLKSSRKPTSTHDKAGINLSTGKSLDEDVQMPDLLISHTSDADVSKVHDLLKSLQVNHNVKN